MIFFKKTFNHEYITTEEWERRLRAERVKKLRDSIPSIHRVLDWGLEEKEERLDKWEWKTRGFPKILPFYKVRPVILIWAWLIYYPFRILKFFYKLAKEVINIRRNWYKFVIGFWFCADNFSFFWQYLSIGPESGYLIGI